MRDHSQYTDQELTGLLKSDDEAGLRLIYRKYWKFLYNEACRRLGDRQQSEELVQDVLADLWEKRAHRDIENLEAYLVTSVKYAVYALYRKKRSLPYFEEPLAHLHYEETQADSALFAKELRAFIDSWLEAQPEKRRTIFKLHFEQDKSSKEISEELAIPQKTVQNILRNTMTGLQSDMAKVIIFIPFFLDNHK